ncbi:hypothetical protein M8494_02775 [Serratia ureilytica]
MDYIKALADPRRRRATPPWWWRGADRAGERGGDAARLRDVLGKDENVRVVIVDTAPEVGAGMGAEPGAVMPGAGGCGVEARAGLRVSAIDAEGVMLSNGERIAPTR